ncbi:DNA polymerase beta [Melanomma pulvis-pyrius CBS 109.77]|uniref:DNA-directed DNA polymerase n=1 Tax=Melanomma pulvis-pyrius CBS 109.77 TaxID=1314802 RepID=A0A6A6X263_9PLEO|nr:DNA polymerase beta [Melanomma pulvis-pyrius CBS 109.77]
MDDDLPSSQTLAAESRSPEPLSLAPNLSSLPPISILSAHFKAGEEHGAEETLRRYGAPLTVDVSKVRVFIGKVGTKRRAEFELRSRKLKVESVSEEVRDVSEDEPPTKRRKLEGSTNKPIRVDDDGSTTEDEVIEDSETEDENCIITKDLPVASPVKRGRRYSVSRPIFENPSGDDIVWVIKLDWLNDCVAAGYLLPLGDHLVYKGKVLERPASSQSNNASTKIVISSPIQPNSQNFFESRSQTGQSILERAKTDVSGMATKPTYKARRSDGHGSQRFEGRSFVSRAQQMGKIMSHKPHLLQATTSEYEGEDSDVPPPPLWVEQGIKYACQRFTPADSLNSAFIAELKKMRTARTLIDDSVGVRAYSTIIASIAAYPYALTSPREILRLPGCDNKTALLFIEWKNMGAIQAIVDFENDPAMQILQLFYNIWGVGAKTARQFYYEKGWTELDDIIEFGWNELDRVQQIGVKYYEEFLSPIPRAEVEHIADVVRKHTVRIRDHRISVTIVGGYRRGKEASGDVDIIVSHPDLESTAGLVKDIVEALEDGEWITHTLLMSLHGTHRDQKTLPFRTTKASGAGFDTLDKALVVWQDPVWPTRDADLRRDPHAKNTNIHRRVDIIISPWRTVGCAVMGWSSGTTFQRDLRRYAKAVRGWKFDSSGIRDRASGQVVQVEGPNGVDGSPEEAERKVFEGLGLEFIPPEMRCTL